MKKLILSAAALLAMLTAPATDLKLQNANVFCNPNKAKDFSYVPEKGLITAHRMAFPAPTSGLLLDMYQPVKVEKIVMPLTKLIVQSKEENSNIQNMQIFAGNDRKKLTAVTGAKIEVVKTTRDGNVPGEDVTVTNLPEARYYQFYSPRQRGYVFGFHPSATKGIKIYASTDAVDPLLAKYPQITAEENAMFASALEPVRFGYCDLLPGQSAVAPPFNAQFGSGAAGWPANGLSKGRRMLEGELASPQQIRAISVDLLRMNPLPHVQEQVDVLKKCAVYTSMDGKNWTRAKVDSATTKFFRDDFKVAKVQRKGVRSYYTRAVWYGNFHGKFFRIDPETYKGPTWVTGSRGLQGMFRFVPAQQTAVKNFELPFSGTNSIKAKIRLANVSKTSGTAVLRFADNKKVLWSSDLAAFKDDEDLIADVPVAGEKFGMRSLELVIQEKGLENALTFRRKFVILPNAASLQAVAGADKFTAQNFTIGGTDTVLYSANAPQAALTYTVPTDGKYGIFATLQSKKAFNVEARDLNKKVYLTLWHPNDYTLLAAGDEFCGAGDFKAGDKITFTAQEKGATIGNVRVMPLCDKMYSVYTASGNIQPNVIVHSDGYSEFYFHKNDDMMAMYERVIKQYSQANIHSYDFCIGTTAVNYPSKFATTIGQQRNVKFYREGDIRAAKRIKELQDRGIHLLNAIRELTKKYNVKLSITQRANAFYEAKSDSLNAQFLLDNKQFWQRMPDGRTKRQPSYAYPEVREFYLNVMKEIIAARPEYVCIEFLRHPTFFMYDKPIIDEYIRRHGKCTKDNYMDANWQKIIQDMLFEHLKNVRAAIDAVDPNIKFAINFDDHRYLAHGLDIARILEAGLVDVISPGIYDVGHTKYFDLKPFVKMAEKSPRKVAVIPRVECTIIGQDPTPEEEKGLIKVMRRSMSSNMLMGLFSQFLADGAHGLRPFNGGGAWLAKTLSNRSELDRFTMYTMPFLDIRREIVEK